MIRTLDLNFLDLPQTIASFLVETGNGPALVETGPHSTFPYLCNELKKLGYQPEEIRHVFLSHIHLDHAGAAWEFARREASIYLHPVGAPHLIDPSRLLKSARRIYKEQMDALWGALEPIEANRLIIVEDGEEIQIGDAIFKAHFTPGHASHHIAWQLGDALFTGDVGGVRIGKGPVVPPCPPPEIYIEQWQASIQKIMKLPVKTLYLTHFGEEKSIDEHLATLKNQLTAWAGWIKPYWEKNVDPKEVIPLFEEYVDNYLRESGLGEFGRQKYANANPAWMSVMGLMRYWSKRGNS